MAVTASDWQVFPLLTVVGLYLGMLGLLYLVYDLFGRQSPILCRLVWVGSSTFLFASVLLVSSLLLIAPERPTGYLYQEVWRFVGIFSCAAFIMQFIFSSPTPVSPPTIDWLRSIFSIVWSSLLLVPLGLVIAPGSSSTVVIIFVLPTILVLGALNGLSPAIQWWILHLPEKRMAAIGALLILCAFVLVLVQPLLVLLGVSPR